MLAISCLFEKSVWEPYDIELHRAHNQIKKSYSQGKNLINKGYARRFIDKGRQLAKHGDIKKARGLARGARIMMKKR